MARDSDDTATGAAAFNTGPQPGVPREVQASFLLWLIAVGAGVVETVIRVIGSLAGGPDSSGLLVRVIVYTVAFHLPPAPLDLRPQRRPERKQGGESMPLFQQQIGSSRLLRRMSPTATTPMTSLASSS
jgi:hypothetical protein